MTTTCVLGHGWNEGWVLCPTCGFGKRNLPGAHEPVAELARTLKQTIREPVLVGTTPAAGPSSDGPSSDGPPQPVADRILSPDGYWAWDGAEWVPADQPPAAPEPERAVDAPTPVTDASLDPAAAELAFTTEFTTEPTTDLTTEFANHVTADLTTDFTRDRATALAAHPAGGPAATPPAGGPAGTGPTGGPAATSPAGSLAANGETEPGAELTLDLAAPQRSQPAAATQAAVDLVADPEQEPDTAPAGRRHLRLDHRLALGALVVLTAVVSSDFAYGLPPLGH